MTRREQVAKLVGFLRKPPFRVSFQLSDGKLWFRHAANLDVSGKERLTAWIGCNAKILERYFAGSIPDDEPAAERLDACRAGNGCAGKCPNFGECVCHRPCNGATLCSWCSGKSTDFPCGVLWGAYETEMETERLSDSELLKDFTVAGGCRPENIESLSKRIAPKRTEEPENFVEPKNLVEPEVEMPMGLWAGKTSFGGRRKVRKASATESTETMDSRGTMTVAEDIRPAKADDISVGRMETEIPETVVSPASAESGHSGLRRLRRSRSRIVSPVCRGVAGDSDGFSFETEN